mmetsp:Transcript_47654/g.147008  ORF Transcript_47654/g.147008 Transcript_47654/m.147008 type:complete len:82 (-) Transcript_47654:51-296(-)
MPQQAGIDGGANATNAHVEFQDDHGSWVRMADADAAVVVAARHGGQTSAVLSSSVWTYDYDWDRMVQINMESRKERPIRLV